MDWNDFYKSIKAGSISSVYLFTGPEELIKREALEKLRKTLLPAGLEPLNEVILEDCSAQTIIDNAETMPVMCEKRIVVVRDWKPLRAAKKKGKDDDAQDGATGKSDDDVSRMLEWFKDTPSSCVLVFYMTVEIDGRKKLCTALSKMGAVVEFKHLSGQVLLKWCNQQLKSSGKSLSQDAANELTMMAGQDLNRLSGELKKLAAYTRDSGEISVQDVRAVVTPSPEYTVFMILDHLLNGDLAAATEVVNTLLKSSPYMTTPLISMFANQLRIDAHMKHALESGSNMAEVRKMLDIKENRAHFIERQIRPFRASALQERYQLCVEADYDVKSGRIKDRAALDALMLKIVMPANATKRRF